MTDEQQITGSPRPKPSRRLGLSGKLLLLTIPLVAIAGMLIYVPAIANFRMNRLNDRLGAATTAGLVRAGARRRAIHRGGDRRIAVAPGDVPLLPQPAGGLARDRRADRRAGLPGAALSVRAADAA